MHGKADVESALAAVERLLGDVASRAATLERAVGVIAALGGDTAPAERALEATYHALGVYGQRRARLLTTLAGYDAQGWLD